MATRSFSFEQFDVRIDDEALWGLVLSRLLGRDLRATGKAVEAFLLDFLLDTQTHGHRLAEGSGPLTFAIHASPSLQQAYRESVEGLQVQTVLLTTRPHIAPILQRLLPSQAGALEVASNPPDPGTFARGGLLLVDTASYGPERALQPLLGLDAVVQRHLLDPLWWDGLSPEEQARAIPFQGANGRRRTATLREARTALRSAVQAALFSQVYQRLQARSLRWLTHLETEMAAGGQVTGTLHFDGTERLMRPDDLRLDVGWGEIPDTRLTDVLGSNDAKARLQEHLLWLTDPHGEPGLKGALLYGPPGTGKTHLCRAVAGEAQVPCILISASEFSTPWIGETERRTRETFAALRDQDAAVMVIDELDALAWSREQSNQWMAQWQTSIMGTLLSAIDGLRKGPGRVLLLATTNQIDRIEPALLRSHRLAERIYMGPPSLEERREILGGLLGGEFDETSIPELASMTTGMTSSDLVQLVETIRNRAGTAPLILDVFRQAVFETRAGERKAGGCLAESARRRVAFHEAGHALLTHDLLGPDRIGHLTILPGIKGELGSLYLERPESEEPPDRTAVKGRLAMYLAGKAAEALAAPDQGASGGVESDRIEATRLAQHAITAWGMDEGLPPVAFHALEPGLQVVLGPRIAERVQAWIQDAEDTARQHLELHWGRVARLAEGVLRAETLHRPDILKLLATDEAGA
ncbi:MAG: AAA family ATPase [Acidobacteriota bacterium]|nr:AAA family ATPase [Acidobacteriota bacterium]